MNRSFSIGLLISLALLAGRADELANDVPGGMVLVPGGINRGTDPDFRSYSLSVQSFFMDDRPVTMELWNKVAEWAVEQGYQFDHPGAAEGPQFPVHTVSWYDAVKWCNARSEKEGRTPCYRVNGEVYRSGRVIPSCDFSANGFRLPTVTEREYAARGGLQGQRFPWGNTIDHSQANYYSSSAYRYDKSPTRGFHPLAVASGLRMMPAGSFQPNGYGLYDMAGNIWEWCWDSHGANRHLRGGAWCYYASYLRCGREYWFSPAYALPDYGFRTVCR